METSNSNEFLAIDPMTADVFARFMIKETWGLKNPPPWLLAWRKGVPYFPDFSKKKEKLMPRDLLAGKTYTMVLDTGEIYE
jgi:hypothetical protein